MIVKLRPFVVPNYVIHDLKGPANCSVSFALGDLDTEELNKMCDEFRANVHMRAAAQRLNNRSPE